MWLDELNELVVGLSEKIDQHREILRTSESATRYCLIDPLLTALGWDLSDPAQVRTEYNSGNGRADYAMMPGGDKPSLVVEAKSLNTPTENARDQTINYCFQDGINYFAITNGNDWEVYATHREGTIEEKRVTDFKITEANQNTVMGMLWLWRGNFGSGEPAKPTFPPVGPITPEPSPPPPPPPPPGTPLSELTDVTGTAPPQFMSFPGGVTKPISKWNRVQIATVEWLVETGRLNESMCPVTSLGGSVVVDMSPHRSTGKEFVNPKKIKTYWVETNYTASNQVKRARDILIAVGVDPTTIYVT